MKDKLTTLIALRLDSETCKELQKYCDQDKVGYSYFLRAALKESFQKRRKQLQLKLKNK